MARLSSVFLIVMCWLDIPPPPVTPLFFCPIVLVIVCNAKGLLEERGGRDHPRRLKQSSERPYREELLRQRQLCQDFPSGHRHECL